MGKLTTEQQKEEIKKLVDEQQDSALIEEVYELLQPRLDPFEREKLIASIKRSEEDIKHGRVLTPEQALERLNQRFRK